MNKHTLVQRHSADLHTKGQHWRRGPLPPAPPVKGLGELGCGDFNISTFFLLCDHRVLEQHTEPQELLVLCLRA